MESPTWWRARKSGGKWVYFVPRRGVSPRQSARWVLNCAFMLNGNIEEVPEQPADLMVGGECNGITFFFSPSRSADK